MALLICMDFTRAGKPAILTTCVTANTGSQNLQRHKNRQADQLLAAAQETEAHVVGTMLKQMHGRLRHMLLALWLYTCNQLGTLAQSFEINAF